MRITNSTILRGYNRDLNRLLTLKNQCEKRITSTRKFSRASEAPLSAAKALNVRKSQYYSAQYKENLKVADKFYTEAETSLLQVSDKMATIRETIIAACNSTKDNEDYQIYAQQLETSAKELCSIFNTDSAGRSIFGGESDNTSPFEIINDSNGNAATVLYHGVPVNAMNDYKGFPYSKDVNIDVGLGMDMNQKTQEIDAQSVLRTSFNGAKISGCGAESGVADVDLSSIKEGRSYCIDVYAGDVKHTVAFDGKATFAENVEEINKQLEKAFKKDDQTPTMDAQGVISVKNGICCAVNNEKAQRTEKLTIDNDSGYTDKFRLNFDALEGGKRYSLDVTVGNVTKSINFEAVADDYSVNPPAPGSEQTIKNVQEALDQAFGKDTVNISDTDPRKGIFSAEGAKVTVADTLRTANAAGDPQTATITAKTVDKIDVSQIKNGQTYRFDLGLAGHTSVHHIEFTGGKDDAETFANIQAALNKTTASTSPTIETSGPERGVIKFGSDPGTILSTNDLPGDTRTVVPGKHTEYTVDLTKMTKGEKYTIKVTYNGKSENIEFTADADPAKTVESINSELNNMFGTKNNKQKLTMDANGKITAIDDANAIVAAVKNVTDSKNSAVKREAVYSNNYIQLTLDAARALRNGDIDYANGCIDRIVSANENLLVEIADMGCNEEFISFNIDRITTREQNLAERQNDLEVTDAKSEITLWKTYEALYNACLQMSSSVVPNSIFNYIS